MITGESSPASDRSGRMGQVDPGFTAGAHLGPTTDSALVLLQEHIAADDEGAPERAFDGFGFTA